MATELNPVTTASNTPGWDTILGSQTSGISDPNPSLLPSYGADTVDPSTLTQTPGFDPSSWQSDLSGLDSLLGGAGGAGAAPSSSSTLGSDVSNLLSTLFGSAAGSSDLAGLGKYAALGGLGFAEASKARSDAASKISQLQGLGTPFVNEAQDLLAQYKAGTLRPDQQAVADLATKQGQTLIDSTGQLSGIAQQAYQDYAAGKLNPADQQRIDQQVAGQKQEVRQKLASMGITDSTILAGQDQQIENQSQILRQQLLDARFATGNTAYDQWMKGTQAGQQLQLEGRMFASKSMDQLLTNAFGAESIGGQPIMQAIQLAVQSDTQISQMLMQYISSLAAAYSYEKAGGGGAAAGGAKTGGGTSLSSLIGDAKSLYGAYQDFFGGGFNSAGGQAAAPIDLGSTDLSSVGAGQMFGTSGSAALGSAGAVGAGDALGSLGSIGAGSLFGTSGSAAAGAGAGSLGGASMADVTGSALPETLSGLGTGGASGAAAGGGSATSALAGSGLSTALPLAAIGWALADALNKSGDIKSASTTHLVDYMTKNQGWTLANPKNQTYKMPDGRFIQVGSKARAVSEALRKGDDAAYQAALQAWMNSANSDYSTAVRNGS